MPPPAATQAAARLWTARPELHTDPLATKLAECMTPPAGSVRRFTRGRVRELKNGHNSITVQNRTHVYMNFFHHKDLGNHLLQLCPKVVKHPVYCGKMNTFNKDTNEIWYHIPILLFVALFHVPSYHTLIIYVGALILRAAVGESSKNDT